MNSTQLAVVHDNDPLHPIYGYENAYEWMETKENPVLVVQDKSFVDVLQDAGMAGICAEGGIWTDEHCEAIRNWSDLVLCFPTKGFRQAFGKAMAGYVGSIQIVDAYNDFSEFVRESGDFGQLLSESLRASEYNYQDDITPKETITATPYEWREPSTIPRRQWLYGNHLIRKFVSCTIAPGGIGKSSLVITEALAMVAGKDLLNVWAGKPKRVWLWNLEDPREEMERRIQAACLHHGLTQNDLGGRLFLNTGRETELCIAETNKGHTKIIAPCFEQMVASIKEREIDVVTIDPFVSSHRVEENDNNAIDLVVKAWGKVAEATGCAIELVHHTRKQNGGTVDAESARGAGAMVAGVRDARTLNPMSADEAGKAGVENHRLYFKVQSDKANMAPPSQNANWYKKNSVDLGNGEQVVALSSWKWPDAFADVTEQASSDILRKLKSHSYRANDQASEWAGNVVAEVLGYDVGKVQDKAKIKAILNTWIRNDVIRSVKKPVPGSSRKPPFIEVVEAKI